MAYGERKPKGDKDALDESEVTKIQSSQTAERLLEGITSSKRKKLSTWTGVDQSYRLKGR